MKMFTNCAAQGDVMLRLLCKPISGHMVLTRQTKHFYLKYAPRS